VPRSASFSTFKLLAGGTGVFATDVIDEDVTFGRGVRVLDSEERGGVHEENMNRIEKRTTRILREKRISTLP
jgi:hypothetical protein